MAELNAIEVFGLETARLNPESIVVKDFLSTRQPTDPLHVALAALPGLQSRLTEIRSCLLGCCSVDAEVLKVVDSITFDALLAEQNLIASKIQAIFRLVEELDDIFRVASERQIGIQRKTLNGIKNRLAESVNNHPGRESSPQELEERQAIRDILTDAEKVWSDFEVIYH